MTVLGVCSVLIQREAVGSHLDTVGVAWLLLFGFYYEKDKAVFREYYQPSYFF